MALYLELYDAPGSPLPDEKRSIFNPFTLCLRLNNLPAAVKPTHLTHVLSYPPTRHGAMSCKRENGVSLVEIYTVPKKVRSSPVAGVKRLLCVTVGRLGARSKWNRLPASAVENDGVHSPSTPREAIWLLGQPETETFAIVHFRDEFSLYRAKDIFRRVTIDGRHVQLKTRRWNGSAMKRLLSCWT
ncbi:hypothetical protein BD324DRAFT_17780 [Kockovaella imperatae]|uniref:Uncharacterized protein n=1 Tax=Kockovaella imperatae TaxID=4999 RepID=A0A1Y1URZ9_9TREE|nr:hypothetical protein BD324DRAFT_17780 [Kockovaella imperatae]ORX40732.1 hypothetical protein BD324DRAFT_17780 [Kockovaella imperatae]